jgi:hypothetical protein
MREIEIPLDSAIDLPRMERIVEGALQLVGLTQVTHHRPSRKDLGAI